MSTMSSAYSSENYTLDPFFVCGICTEKYPAICIYSCDRGHLVCTRCYKQEYYVGKDTKCPFKNCNCWMSKTNPPSSEDHLGCLKKKMFPCPWEVSLSKKILQNPTKSFSSLNQTAMNDNNPSVISLSRKPIYCPYHSCNKTIAVTTISDHFRYEHSSVAFLDTKLETRNGLNFCLEDIHYNQIYCILLINLMHDLQKCCSKSSSIFSESKSSTPPIKPVILVMAIRVHCSDLPSDCEDNYSVLNTDEDNSSDYDPVTCTPDDRIFIWAGSNIAVKFTYTLAVSTISNDVRLKYYGPMMTLNEDPLKLCGEGRGLILSNFHVKGMSDNSTKPLVMDVIVHGELDNELSDSDDDDDDDGNSTWKDEFGCFDDNTEISAL